MTIRIKYSVINACMTCYESYKDQFLPFHFCIFLKWVFKKLHSFWKLILPRGLSGWDEWFPPVRSVCVCVLYLGRQEPEKKSTGNNKFESSFQSSHSFFPLSLSFSLVMNCDSKGIHMLSIMYSSFFFCSWKLLGRTLEDKSCSCSFDANKNG